MSTTRRTRTEQLRRQAAVIRDRVLVETNLFAQLLGIQSPAFAIGVEAQSMQPKLRQPRELLVYGVLHVMPRHSFVIRHRLIVDQ